MINGDVDQDMIKSFGEVAEPLTNSSGMSLIGLAKRTDPKGEVRIDRVMHW